MSVCANALTGRLPAKSKPEDAYRDVFEQRLFFFGIERHCLDMGEGRAHGADFAQPIFWSQIADKARFGGPIKLLEHRLAEIRNDLILQHLQQRRCVREDRFDRRARPLSAIARARARGSPGYRSLARNGFFVQPAEALMELWSTAAQARNLTILGKLAVSGLALISDKAAGAAAPLMTATPLNTLPSANDTRNFSGQEDRATDGIADWLGAHSLGVLL